MSSSASSSRSFTRRTTVGIPNRCWCGANLTTFAAQTKENLYRRFYRCEVAIQRKSEHHLFKWVDEAILDELNKVDSKICQLEADVDSFNKLTTQRFENQGKYIDDALLEMRRILEEQTKLVSANNPRSTEDTSALCTEDTFCSFNHSKSQSPVLNIAVATIALGSMAWLYVKFTT